MKIEIFDIPEEGLDIELEETPEIEGVKITQPFKAVLRIEKKGPEVFVDGLIAGQIELQCSRCLKEYRENIRSMVKVIYHPIEELNKEALVELKSEEMDIDFYKEGYIDTTDIIRDQILLNIPMKPLCSEDCKGICPVCGVDLNEFTCECKTKEIDPRLAALQILLRRMKANG